MSPSPTHERGGTLDPVISNYQEDSLQCHQLGLLGSSDEVLTKIDVDLDHHEATTRTIWLWNKADLASVRHDLSYTQWVTLLQGRAERGALAPTSHFSPSRDATYHTGISPPDRRSSHRLATVAVLLLRQSTLPGSATKGIQLGATRTCIGRHGGGWW